MLLYHLSQIKSKARLYGGAYNFCETNDHQDMTDEQAKKNLELAERDLYKAIRDLVEYVKTDYKKGEE